MRKKLTMWVKRCRKLLGEILLSAGYFSVDEVRVLHPGILIDQEAAAQAIRTGIEIAKQKHPARLVDPLLRLITVRFRTRPIRSGVAWLDHHAAWRGGSVAFDRGILQVNYLADDWEKITTRGIVALIRSELRSNEDARPEVEKFKIVR